MPSSRLLAPAILMISALPVFGETVTVRVEQGSDSEQARGNLVAKAIAECAPDVPFDAVKGEARKKLVQGFISIVNGEVEVRDGKTFLRATVDLAAANRVVNEALDLPSIFSKEVMIVLLPAERDSNAELLELVGSGALEHLVARSFRPKIADEAMRKRVDEARKSLGVDPGASEADLARLFKEELVFTIRGDVREKNGLVGGHGRARAYDRDTGSVLAELALEADAKGGALGFAPVALGNDAAATKRQQARVLGQKLARNLVARLIEKYLGEPRKATAADAYTLRFKGFADGEAEAILAALASREGFADWSEKIQDGELSTWRCSFVGKVIVVEVRKAVEEASLKAEIRKSGSTIDVLKK